MAEFLVVAGAASSFINLFEFARSVLAFITDVAASFRGDIPIVLMSAISKVTIWQHHLRELCEIGQDERINEHLRQLLKEDGVLNNVQDCLKQLQSIISDAMPKGEQNRASAMFDRAVFHSRKKEVQDLLKRMDDNAVHVQMALQTNFM